MKLIKIDRSTIRINPEYVKNPSGIYKIDKPKSVGVNFKARAMEGLQDILNDMGVLVTEFNPSDLSVKGEVINKEAFEKFSEFDKIDGVEISVQGISDFIHGIPPSKHIFEWKLTYLTCEYCGSDTAVQDIDKDDYNGVLCDICPHCGALNSFEDYEYETLTNEMINEAKLH